MRKKKLKEDHLDGLSPRDISKIRIAIRRVWSWSHPKKLVVKRASLPNGYAKCDACKKKVPKIYVDHIIAVGDVDAGFIARLFCPSSGLQALCKKCHDEKTKAERKAKRLADYDLGF